MTILRAMPMGLATLAGGIIAGFFDSAALVVVFVPPVNLALDVFGHFAERGMPADPGWDDPDSTE